MGPAVKGNPLIIFVILLVVSYIIGEFIIPKYVLLNLLNLIGVIGLIISLAIFFTSLNLFNSYKENPTPQANTKRVIKTGIFAYCRNPMYLAFISFHFSMFLTFENVANLVDDFMILGASSLKAVSYTHLTLPTKA